MPSPYRGKNVLVAGGAGMIGHSLAGQLLAAGAHVRATEFKARQIDLVHPHLEVMACDLRDDTQAQAAFADMDIVFLAAAKVGGAKLIKEDPSSLIMYNLELHARLLHMAARMNLEKCTFVSSSYVYPDTGKPNVEDEGFAGNPWMPTNYGLGWIKRYLETLCKHFHMTSRTSYAIVRPTAIYGPHDNFNPEESHAVPALIVKAVNRMDPFEVWGTGQDVRSFTFVDDLAEGLMLTAEKYAVAEALNICPREAHSITDVVHTILELLGFQPTIVYNSDKPSAIPYKVSDPSRAFELIGWRAKTSLREGLKRTIDWYIEQTKGQRHASRAGAVAGGVSRRP